MATAKRPFWHCNRDIVRDSIFCLGHDLEKRQGWIDECPICKRYKYTQYETCFECDPSKRQDRSEISQAPGTYRADGNDTWYWERLADFSHESDGIIVNGINPTIIEISNSDAGFSSYGCGRWSRV